MSKYLDVSNLNTMHVRESYDGTRYIELGVRTCQCTYFAKPRYWGKQAKQVPCPKCAGSGKVSVRKAYVTGIRGTKRYYKESIECKACYGTGRFNDWKQAEVCVACQGSCVVPQNICDTLPDKYVDSLELRVYREGTHEHVTKRLGMHQTACYSCSDYGDHTRLTDEQLIASVRANSCMTHVQATKLALQDKQYPTSFKFAHHIGILCSKGGYEVMAIFDDSPLVPIEETPKYHDRRKALQVSELPASKVPVSEISA